MTTTIRYSKTSARRRTRRRAMTRGLVAFAVVASLGWAATTPVAALDCESRDDRSSVQCSKHKKTVKGGTSKNQYQVQPGLSFTIDDAGGADTLKLNQVGAGELKLRGDGKDLIVSYPRGSVRIKNHLGSGRIETITATGTPGSNGGSGAGGRGSGSVRSGTSSGQHFVEITSFGITVREPINPNEANALDRATKRAEKRINDEVGSRANDGTNGGQVRGADPGVGRNDVPDSF